MADVDHPKTHVENQDLDEARTQPESPKHEGIDPLTEGDTMYPAEDTKTDSEKLSETTSAERSDADIEAQERTTDTVVDQQEVNAKAATPDANLPDDAKTANHVDANADNTSPSNKAGTQAEAGTDGTATPDAAASK